MSNAEQLRQRYAELDDAALLKLVQSAGLTDEAQIIALLELSSRGIHLPSTPSDQNAETLFEQNEDMNADLAGMDALSVVARFSMPIEAQMLEARLHAEGIPAWASNTNTVQALSHLALALGGVRVMVPTHLLPEARDVIRRLEAGEFALSDDVEASD